VAAEGGGLPESFAADFADEWASTWWIICKGSYNHLYTYVCMYDSVYIYMHSCIHTYIDTYIFIFMCECVCVYVCMQRLHFAVCSLIRCYKINAMTKVTKNITALGVENSPYHPKVKGLNPTTATGIRIWQKRGCQIDASLVHCLHKVSLMFSFSFI
jgi:hypothetical protein